MLDRERTEATQGSDPALQAELEHHRQLNAQLQQRLEQLEHQLASRADRGQVPAIFEHSAVGQCQTSLTTGRFLAVNDRLCQITGYSREELLATTFRQLTHPDDRETDQGAVREMLAGTRTEYTVEKRYVRKDGSLVWVKIDVIALQGDSGPYALTIVQDITSRIENERKLRQQTHVLQTLNRVNVTLAAELDLEKLVQTIVDAGVELTEAEFGAFFYNVLKEPGEAYMLYALAGAPREAFDQFPMPRNTAVFAPTFSGERVVRLDDVTQDPRYGQNEPYRGMPQGHLPVRSYLAVPVIALSGEVLGGLFFGHHRTGVFSAAHEELVNTVAAQAAVAIDKARLFRAKEENEALLRGTFENEDVGIGRFDSDGQWMAANERLCKILGKSFAELRQTRAGELIAAFHADREEMQQLVSGARQSFSAETRFVRSDGLLVSVNCTVSILRDGRSRPIRFVAVVEDVTERSRAEDALKFLARASETLNASLDYEKTLTALANLAVPNVADWCVVDILGADGRVHRLATAHSDPAKVELALRLHQRYPMQPGDPHGVARVLRTGCAELMEDIPDTLLAKTARDEEHLRILRELGLASYLCVPLVARGQVIGALSLVTDAKGRRFDRHDLALMEEIGWRAGIAIDNARLFYAAQMELEQRREAQKQLRASNDRLEFTLQATSIGTWEWDVASDHVHWSDNMHEVHGIARERFPTSVREFLDHVHANDRRDLQHAVADAMRGSGAYCVEYRVVADDGRLLWMEGKGRVIFDEQRRPLRMAGICTNITERKDAEQSLREVNRELLERNQEMEQFVYTVSHDLKSPVVTAIGFVGLLKEDLAAGRMEDVHDSIQRLDRATRRMSELIDDLLQLSRIGRVPQYLADVDIGALVHELKDELSDRFAEAQATLHIADDMPSVHADRARMVEVFENLLTNAIKYGCQGERSLIEVGAEQREGQWIYYVRDNGPGIEPQFHHKIFGLFQRLDSTQEGTGVGLAIVARVMQVHGGRVWVESQPGGGAKFCLAFGGEPIGETLPSA